MHIRHSIKEISQLAVSWRRALHAHPQTAYEETYASKFIQDKLTEWSIPFTKGLAHTGIVGTIIGKGNPNSRSIGLRADMDALDISETTNKSWTSTYEGKMHACGHDGHVAMLLAAAKYLQETRNFSGKVHLVFQPAEENLNGADRMIKDGLFEKFPMESIYGMHNWPYMPKGKIAMCPGAIMAGDDIFTATIIGRSGHAAMPHTAKDPIPTLGAILQAVQTLISREMNPMDAGVLSITNVHSGTGAVNVIPNEAYIKGSVRTLNPKASEQIEAGIKRLFKGIAESHDMKVDINYLREVPVTVNSKTETEFCAKVAESIVGKENVDSNITPAMTAEDFGSMLQKVPGCYIWIGQANTKSNDNTNQSLHSSEYDFNDDIIPIGAEYWTRLVEAKLKPDEIKVKELIPNPHPF